MNFLQQTKLSKAEWCKMEEAITNKKEHEFEMSRGKQRASNLRDANVRGRS